MVKSAVWIRNEPLPPRADRDRELAYVRQVKQETN